MSINVTTDFHGNCIENIASQRQLLSLSVRAFVYVSGTWHILSMQLIQLACIGGHEVGREHILWCFVDIAHAYGERKRDDERKMLNIIQFKVIRRIVFVAWNFA